MQVGVNQVCVVEWSAGLQVIENSPLAPPPRCFEVVADALLGFLFFWLFFIFCFSFSFSLSPGAAGGERTCPGVFDQGFFGEGEQNCWDFRMSCAHLHDIAEYFHRCTPRGMTKGPPIRSDAK